MTSERANWIWRNKGVWSIGNKVAAGIVTTVSDNHHEAEIWCILSNNMIEHQEFTTLADAQSWAEHQITTELLTHMLYS